MTSRAEYDSWTDPTIFKERFGIIYLLILIDIHGNKISFDYHLIKYHVLEKFIKISPRWSYSGSLSGPAEARKNCWTETRGLAYEEERECEAECYSLCTGEPRLMDVGIFANCRWESGAFPFFYCDCKFCSSDWGNF